MKRTKFAELIIKCLWKIAKRLDNSFKDNLVDAQQLLLDIENFLLVIPPSEWKQRAVDKTQLADYPFRTLKALLQKFTEFYGEEALNLLDLIEKPVESHVYNQLLRQLNADKGHARSKSTTTSVAGEDLADTLDNDEVEVQQPAEKLTETRSSNPTRAPISSPKSPPSSNSADDSDNTGAELKNIFQRISHKEESRPAIKDLYEFQKKYPHKEASVSRALAETGPIFQRYIKRALANLEREDPDAVPDASAADDSEWRHVVDGLLTLQVLIFSFSSLPFPFTRTCQHSRIKSTRFH